MDLSLLSGLAFAYTNSSEADLFNIEIMQDWTSKMNNLRKVPSVISYTKASSGEAQWGTDISKDAVTMVNTKLELELQASLFDELDLTLNVLKGTGSLAFEHLRQVSSDPAYTCKSPTDIVTNYLTKIFDCVRNEIAIDALAHTKTPVDVVITVPPVRWPPQPTVVILSTLRRTGPWRLMMPFSKLLEELGLTEKTYPP